MFRKILVPIDLTDKHHPALSQAANLARGSNGTITLLHVIEEIPGLNTADEKDFFQRIDSKAREHLQAQRDFLNRWGLSAQVEVRYGNRAREIARYADEAGCDLIVLTAPRFDASQPTAGWGSLSYRAGILAKCPVLLVK